MYATPSAQACVSGVRIAVVRVVEDLLKSRRSHVRGDSSVDRAATAPARQVSAACAMGAAAKA